MDFLSKPLALFQNASQKHETVFVSVYPVPGGKSAALLYQEGHPDDLWPLVDSTIRHAATRYSTFNVRVARGSRNDPSPINIPVAVHEHSSNNVAAINGLGGYNTPHGAADIGAIKQELETKFQERLEAYKTERDLSDRISGLEYELKNRRRRTADTWERIEGFVEQTQLDLSNPQSIHAVGAIVDNALSKILGLFQRPSNSGVPAVHGNTTQVVEKGGTTPVPIVEQPIETGENDEPDSIDFNRAIRMELSYNGITEPGILAEDYNPAIEALMLIKNAGADNPGEMLMRVAKFYESNPEQAKNLIENFLK